MILGIVQTSYSVSVVLRFKQLNTFSVKGKIFVVSYIWYIFSITSVEEILILISVMVINYYIFSINIVQLQIQTGLINRKYECMFSLIYSG